MLGRVSGSVSKDFPLYHSNIIPTYENPNDKKIVHRHPQSHNIITNEHPDIFRLDGLKEGGYKNPFLDQIIKVDRNEYFKKLSEDRRNLNFIDFIKSNRKYSQEPKILRYIGDEDKVELSRKRRAFETRSVTIDNSNKYVLTENTNKKEYNDLLTHLNYLSPKINYRIKRTLALNKSFDNSLNNNNVDTEPNKNLYKKINFEIDKNLARNFRNSSDFEIGYNKDDKKINEFIFNRKNIEQYNPVKDKMETIVPPPYKNPKWTNFLENYFFLMNSDNQFKRRGGLFSEFTDRNIGSIINNKYDIRQKKQKEKEEQIEKKQKKDEDDKNLLKNGNKFK